MALRTLRLAPTPRLTPWIHRLLICMLLCSLVSAPPPRAPHAGQTAAPLVLTSSSPAAAPAAGLPDPIVSASAPKPIIPPRNLLPPAARRILPPALGITGALLHSTPSQASGGCDLTTGICVFPITQSSDDAGVIPGCTYTTTNNEVYFGQCSSSSTNLISGFRFPTEVITPSARILDAYIDFVVDGPYDTGLALEIAGSTTDQGTFSSTVRPDTLTRTSTRVNWTVPTSDHWVLGQRRRTPNLAPIIDEVITGGAWSTATPLTFIVEAMAPAVTPGSNPAHRRVLAWDRAYPQIGDAAARLVLQLDGPFLLPDLAAGQSDCACANPATGQPVNLRFGAFWTSVRDLSVDTAGPALIWQRNYSSRNAERTAGLGYGWQHPYAVQAITPAMPGGLPHTIQVIAPDGTTQRFTDPGDGMYRPRVGVYSTIISTTTTLTQTLRDQTQYVFDATDGRLTTIIDPLGRTLSLSYAGAPSRLEAITDAANPDRALALTYDANDQVETVSDGTRTLTYTYDTNDDLVSAADVLGRTTSYTYTNHVLTRITDPLGDTVEEMDYDVLTSSGRVIEQTLQDGRVLAFDYQPDATEVTISGSGGATRVERYSFDERNTLTATEVNDAAVQEMTVDGSFSPGLLYDGNGNPTLTAFTTNGLPLTQTNALSQTTAITYDAANRPLSLTDALSVTTRFRYDSYGNVISTTVGLTDTNPLGLTTLYTYTYEQPNLSWGSTESGAIDSRLFEILQPDGVQTRYLYEESGLPHQPTRVIQNYDDGVYDDQEPDRDIVTRYGYDALGRLTTTTVGDGTAFERTDRTEYRADNTIARTIQNEDNSVFDPAAPDVDVTTTYGYDPLGRTIAITNTLGQVQVTRYNAHGRVEATARNVAPFTVDGDGQPIIPAFDPATPDQNVATLYSYDGLGRIVLVTERGLLTGTFDPDTLQFSGATTRVTRTEYDSLSRPITTTLDYGGLNIQTLTYYDGASNPIWQRDALGRWTKTEYDALNRPITTTLNYEDGDPLTGPRDADILTVTHYDAAGRTDRQIDNWVNGAFTATEPITDRVTLSAYDMLGRVISTTLNYAPGESGTDLNRVQTTAYDASTGRLLGQQDALGRWTSQQYDLLGRVTATIQNCRTSGNVATATGCAAFSSTYSDRNVPAQTRYDALGRAFETVDALGRVTHTAYDGLGRAIATTQNYISSGSVLTDTNVTTRIAYDALGHTLVMTDALGHASTSSYNGLGQTQIVTDTAGRVTRMGYDGTGTLRWSKRNDGQLTLYQVDKLGRTVATIVNYQDGVVGANEPAASDLTTTTVYDAASRRVQTIDPAGRATIFAYDDQDHLIAVTENATSGSCTQTPCNVITQYQYNRAGNRTAIIDANGHVRRFSYDAANQPAEARDALDNVTSWDYDAGGRVTAQHDPRGTSNDLSYSYDDLDRLTAQSASNLGTIGAQYDALGRRLSLTDGTGTTSFGYDALGRMRSVDAPDTGQIGYDYDARGARTKLIYPDDTAIQYGYWPDGQLKVVTGTTTLASYSYDSAGRLQAVARANGATTTYAYDSADRLADLSTTISTTLLSDFAYQTDRLGMRTAVTETLSLNAPPPTGGGLTGVYYHGMGLATPVLTRTDTTVDFSWAGDAPDPTIPADGYSARWSGQVEAPVSGVYTFFVTSDDGVRLWVDGEQLVDAWVDQGPTEYSSVITLTAGLRYDLALEYYENVGDATIILEWQPPGAAREVIPQTQLYPAVTPPEAGTGLTGVYHDDVLLDSPVLTRTDTTVNFSWGAGAPDAALPDDGFSVRWSGQVEAPVSGVYTFFVTSDDGARLWVDSEQLVDAWVDQGPTENSGVITLTAGLRYDLVLEYYETVDDASIMLEWDLPGVGRTVIPRTRLFPALPEVVVPGEGTGLTAVYHDDVLLSSPVLTRTDTTVNFSWGGGAPDALLPDDGFSTRWSGQVEAPVSGVYTFIVTADDGVRLWVDGTQLVDAWVDQGPTEYTGVITLTAGLRYDLALEYYENVGGATIILEWEPPGSGRVVIPQAYLYAESPPAYPTTRAITYAYDGLLRLTEANESPGASYAYGYDNAGNRTGVWVNGTRTVTQTFNAANQVDGISYDAAGNLTDDGTATYTYDALGRMIIRNTTPYTYNGDGALVFDGATRYTQDLAAPLTQILQITQGITTTNYLYGLDRLAAVAGGTRTWYVGDALGSVRMTLDDGGAPLDRLYYDPWGNPESGTVPTFGFTGELQDASSGLVNLRARWYSTGQATFTSRDPFAGYPEQPYSLHQYAYGYSNPVLNTDPSGKCIPYIDQDCRFFWQEGVTYTGWQDFGDYWRGPAGTVGLTAASILLPPVGVVWGGLEFAKRLDNYQRNPTSENRLDAIVSGILFACSGLGGGISGPRAGAQGALVWASSPISIGAAARVGIAARGGAPAFLAQSGKDATEAGDNDASLQSDGEIIVSADDVDYYAYDSKRPDDLYAHGVLTNGTLLLDFQTKGPGGLRNPHLRGRQQFMNILEHFKGKVRIIQGNWEAGRQPDNLNIFNQLIREGKSGPEAALGTRTGEWAAAANYGDAQVVYTEGQPGYYTKVLALFEPSN